MDLHEIVVRPVSSCDEPQYQELMCRHHYLGALPKISEALWYVATWREVWVALLSFSASALTCRARDRWIGWHFRQRGSRLKLVTNNSRFLILPEGRVPNLGSRVLSLCQRRLASDRDTTFGHGGAMAASGRMYLRPNYRAKDGKEHPYWSLVEMVRTPDGPRQRTVCYLGELNHSAQARWLEAVEVFDERGERRQLKLFPSEVAPPENDPEVARVLTRRVRFARARQLGICFPGLELWKRPGLERFWETLADEEAADVAWSRVAALLAINRRCALSSELGIEERWYPATALDDLSGFPAGVVNDTHLYRCLHRLLPHKTKLEST